MPRNALRLAVLFALLGTLSWSSLPHLFAAQAGFYKQSEPYFASPIPILGGMLLIRNDTYGKGHFGASRNGSRKHEGLDLSLEIGKPVYASKSGRVSFSGQGKGYGQYLEISHPDGSRSRYAHLSALKVPSGEWVLRGQEIGLSGKTGNADHPRIRPHLHFEIRKDGKALNPAGWLDPDLPWRK